ncbi:MAG TPA: acryloyl-CoA reductase [Steroidobacteraceae bacterium]
MSPFAAFRIHQQDGKISGRLERLTLDDLSPGEVVIRVTHSGINYKDALAATGAGKILRRFPLVGGIDLAGVVESSTDPSYRQGAAVLVTGCNLSETRDGGYAEFARVPADAVVPMPPGLDTAAAMGVGTAGYAAALAIGRLEHNGLHPGQGPVAVTGASGGVGALAIDMLAARGYAVTAITGKAENEPWLRALGAAEVLLRTELTFGKQPLGSARWAAAIDNAGGELLNWLLATTQPFGSVASIGLVGSAELHTTVMPFILRNVSLLGVNSSSVPRELYLGTWARIANDLKPRHLAQIVTRTVSLKQLPEVFGTYLSGGLLGRTVVRIA